LTLQRFSFITSPLPFALKCRESPPQFRPQCCGPKDFELSYTLLPASTFLPVFFTPLIFGLVFFSSENSLSHLASRMSLYSPPFFLLSLRGISRLPPPPPVTPHISFHPLVGLPSSCDLFAGFDGLDFSFLGSMSFVEAFS